MKKKLLSWLLVMALVLTMVPGQVFAATGGLDSVILFAVSCDLEKEKVCNNSNSKTDIHSGSATWKPSTNTVILDNLNCDGGILRVWGKKEGPRETINILIKGSNVISGGDKAILGSNVNFKITAEEGGTLEIVDSLYGIDIMSGDLEIDGLTLNMKNLKGCGLRTSPGNTTIDNSKLKMNDGDYPTSMCSFIVADDGITIKNTELNLSGNLNNNGSCGISSDGNININEKSKLNISTINKCVESFKEVNVSDTEGILYSNKDSAFFGKESINLAECKLEATSESEYYDVLNCDNGNIIIDGKEVLKEDLDKSQHISPANFSKVDEAIGKIPANLDDYTDETVTVLTNAKDAVDRTKNYKEQTDVDNMAVAIENAITGLKYKPADYTAVNDAKAKAQALVESDYENYSIVTEAIAKVEEGKNITEQEAVNAMAQDILNAIDNLKGILADYTSVNNAKKQADELIKENYKDFSGVEEAISAVVDGKLQSKQDEVNAMAEDILEAINKLEYKPADYTAVNDAKVKAQALVESDYENYSIVTEAIAKVEEGKNITEQEAVNTMAQDILNAIDNLKGILANYDAVDKAVAKAENLVPGDYYDFSEVEKAIKAVKKDLLQSKQNEVDAMAEAITGAIDKLVKIPPYIPPYIPPTPVEPEPDKPVVPDVPDVPPEPENPEQPVKPGVAENVQVVTDNGLFKVTFDKVTDATKYRVHIKQDGKTWTYYQVKNNSIVVKNLYKKPIVKNGKYQVKVVAWNGEVKGDDSQVQTIYANRIGTKPATMYAPKFTSLTFNKTKAKTTTAKVVAKKVYVKNTPKNLHYKVSYRLKGTKTWKSAGYSAKNVKYIKGLKKGKIYNFALRYRYQSAVDGKTYVYGNVAYRTVKVK